MSSPARLPVDTPNRFPWSMWPKARRRITGGLQGPEAITSDFIPMVRGRLTRIAGQAVGEDAARGGVNRRAQLHYHLATLPPTTRAAPGQWARRQGEVSVDEVLAGQLGTPWGRPQLHP